VVLAQFTLFLLIGAGLSVLRDRELPPFADSLPNDAAFGAFIVNYLPRGVVGLVIAAVLSVAMSSLASSMSSSASAFIADFYRPLRPDRSDAHYLLASRVMTTVWGLARIGVAMLAVGLLHGDRSVVNQVLGIAGFTTGIVLGLFLLGRMSRPVPSSAALAGLLTGFGVVLCAWLPSQWKEEWLAWPWYVPLGTASTVLAALAVHRTGIGQK